jgi:Polyketide cyclase / dehydrase and lipid transport
MIEIEHTAHSAAPRAQVWAKLADLESWHEWGPWTKTGLDGDVRTMVSERKRLTGKPYVMHERVIRLAPETTEFEYLLVDGLPVKNYSAVVRLTDAPDGGTDIHWGARFDAPWPIFKGLWFGAMSKVIRQVSEALASASAIKV